MATPRYNDLPKSKRQQIAMEEAKTSKAQTLREFVAIQEKLAQSNPPIKKPRQ